MFLRLPPSAATSCCEDLLSIHLIVWWIFCKSFFFCFCFFKFPFSPFKLFTDMVFKGAPQRGKKCFKGVLRWVSKWTPAGFGSKYQFSLPFPWISDESEKEQPCPARWTMNALRCEEGNRGGFLKHKGVGVVKTIAVTFVQLGGLLHYDEVTVATMNQSSLCAKCLKRIYKNVLLCYEIYIRKFLLMYFLS